MDHSCCRCYFPRSSCILSFAEAVGKIDSVEAGIVADIAVDIAVVDTVVASVAEESTVDMVAHTIFDFPLAGCLFRSAWVSISGCHFLRLR